MTSDLTSVGWIKPPRLDAHEACMNGIVSLVRYSVDEERYTLFRGAAKVLAATLSPFALFSDGYYHLIGGAFNLSAVTVGRVVPPIGYLLEVIFQETFSFTSCMIHLNYSLCYFITIVPTPLLILLASDHFLTFCRDKALAQSS